MSLRNSRHLRVAGQNLSGRSTHHVLQGVERVSAETSASGWGWLPLLSLLATSGLLIIALADTGARNGAVWAEPLFWAGLLIIYAPISARLLLSRLSRLECIGLVIVLGLGLYLVKVLHSPLVFTLHDEFLHWRTANDILQSGRLFDENPLLPVSAVYPGLEIATTAIVHLSGLDLFSAGIVLVGAARLVLVLALYLFYECVSASSRVAAIATLLYMANPNYLFFSSMLSYESLALSFVALILYVLARRANVFAHERVRLSVVAVIGLGALITIHHLSSFALIGLLSLWTLIFLHQTGRLDLLSLIRAVTRWYAGEATFRQVLSSLMAQLRLLRRKPLPKSGHQMEAGPGGIALLAIAATLAWLLTVGSITLSYLTPSFTSAASEFVGLIANERGAGRQLFVSSTGQVSPLWERLTGLAAAGLITLGLPFGWVQVWRRYRQKSAALMLTGLTLAYPLSLFMRLTGGGWEIANRSSEFLFIAVGFVLALGVNKPWLSTRLKQKRVVWLVASVSIIFLGGIIAGWTPSWRLPGPYIAASITRSIEPQGLMAAAWARAYLGSDNRMGADRTNELLMGSYGNQHILNTLSGGVNVNWILFAPTLAESEAELIQSGRVRYLVIDFRLRDAPQVAQSYFPRTPMQNALKKFDGVRHISRLFDSGDIIIYDVGVLSSAE